MLVLILRVWETYAQRGVPSLAYTRQKLEQAIHERLEDNLIAEEDAEALYAQVEQWLTNPKDINQITSEELAEYHLLSPYQIYQFILFRTRQSQGITSLYDLKTIPGWNEELAICLAPLFRIDNSSDERWADKLNYGRLEASVICSKSSQATEKTHLGSPYSLALRASYQIPDRISTFVGAELDRGEPWLYRGRKGFDSYTGHAAVHHLGVVRSLVIGDYRASWGEGLTINQGFRLRPPHVSSRRSTGIRPISSVAESDRSRGIAITLERNRWQLIALYSKLHLDGNIEGENISALSETGLHRTERELAHRRRVPMKHWGAHLGWRGDQLNLGVGALSMSFAPYRLVHSSATHGRESLNLLQKQSYITLDYQWVSRSGRWKIGGEIARSSIGGYAWAQQIQRSGMRWGDISISMRYISPKYWAYYGRSYTHHMRPNNERGLTIYASSRELLKQCELSFGLDLYEQLSNKHRGLALRATASYHTSHNQSLRYTLSYQSADTKPKTLRMSLTYKKQTERTQVAPYIALSQTAPHHWSWALALRVDRAISKRVKIWTNIARYKADWQGRLYLPEPNMKHQYGFSMLYGKGIRLASGLEWLCTKRITLALRGVYTPSDTKTMANGNYIALGVYYR